MAPLSQPDAESLLTTVSEHGEHHVDTSMVCSVQRQVNVLVDITDQCILSCFASAPCANLEESGKPDMGPAALDWIRRMLLWFRTFLYVRILASYVFDFCNCSMQNFVPLIKRIPHPNCKKMATSDLTFSSMNQN